MFHFCRIYVPLFYFLSFLEKKVMPETVSMYPLGESALTVSFGNSIDKAVNQQVFSLYQALIINKDKFWLDLIPAYCTLTICYDPTTVPHHTSTAFEWVKQQVSEVLANADRMELQPVRHIHLPVCYHDAFALDAKLLCEQKKISVEELITIHTQQSYRVYMLGFLPGFPYMGSVDPRIAMPRLTKPRTSVPMGSVGIAGEQTGIYPLGSPGGWNIIGRTPMRLFDAQLTPPVLLQPGDEISFISISKKEFENFDAATFKLGMYES